MFKLVGFLLLVKRRDIVCVQKGSLYTTIQKQMANKDLWYSTGNSTQHSVTADGEKKLKRADLYIRVPELLCCIPNTTV